MAIPNITTMARLQITVGAGSAAVLPVQDLAVNDSPIVNPVGTGSLAEVDAQIAAGSGAIMVTATIPFKDAADELGVVVNNITALGVFFADVSGGIIDFTNCLNYGLVSGATCTGKITSVSANQDTVAMATVEFKIYSPDGTDPLEKKADAAAPTVGLPTLHTIGLATVNGSALDGTQSMSITIARTSEEIRHDGLQFPTGGLETQSRVNVNLTNVDAEAVRDITGGEPVAISPSVIIKLRSIASGSGVVSDSAEMTLTMGNGVISPASLTGSNGVVTTHGLDIIPIADSDNNPAIVIS